MVHTGIPQEQIGPVFIKELLKRDYPAGIFASASLTTPPFDRTIFNDIKDLRSSTRGETPWERDNNALDEWRQWIENRDNKRPFFSFIFLDSMHGYSSPPDYPEVFKPAWERVDHVALNKDFDPEPYLNRYKNSAHYADALIGVALKDLENLRLLDNTIIVFTGDHGEEFNDNRLNYWGHGGNYTRFQTQVPLAIYWPGQEEKNISNMTSHLDIVPTFMKDLFKCKNPASDYSNGLHLLDETIREWLIIGGYFNHAIVEQERITVSFSSGGYEIFDTGNRVLKNAQLNFKVIKPALEETTRFYK